MSYSLYLYKYNNTLKQEQKQRLNEIYGKFKDHNAKWISKQECMALKCVDENSLFVLSTFEGSVFDHLKKMKARYVTFLS